MKAYLLILEIDPIEAGKDYDSLPLHCTLVHWFWLDEAKVSQLIAVLPTLMPPQVNLTVQDEEVFTGFTTTGTVPVKVNKVAQTPELKILHQGLCDSLDRLGATYEKPEFIREGYVPHITHQKGRSVSRGDHVQAIAIALLEATAPEYGNPRQAMYTVQFSQVSQ